MANRHGASSRPEHESACACQLPHPILDETTSHSTKASENDAQVAGYPPEGEGENESLRELHIDQPLAGLKILVTRPHEQAVHLVQAIEHAGGIPLLRPLLQIAPAENADVLKAQVLHLADADLAIFISPNAVQYGMAAIQASGVALPPAVATIGPGSAKALGERGVGKVLLPDTRHDSEGLLEQLPEVTGWRVMIFRGEGGRELLGETLRARGASVEYVTCYRRSKADLDVGELLNAHPDAMVVTSSEALAHLRQQADTLPGRRISEIPLFVPHPRIAELAREQGWSHVYLTGTGDEGLLATLQDWAKKQD